MGVAGCRPGAGRSLSSQLSKYALAQLRLMVGEGEQQRRDVVRGIGCRLLWMQVDGGGSGRWCLPPFIHSSSSPIPDVQHRRVCPRHRIRPHQLPSTFLSWCLLLYSTSSPFPLFIAMLAHSSLLYSIFMVSRA